MNEILLIEDDPKLNQNIKEVLSEEGFSVEAVFDGLLAERLMNRKSFECIILDINLPGKNGYDLCLGFRKTDMSTPVLMLTAFDELEDKVKGYECGADDYLTKPFYMKELVLKVKSLIKRSPPTTAIREGTTDFRVSDISVHPGQRKVFRQGREVQLTPREYQILLKLLQADGEVVTKKDLIREIWGKNLETNTNTIEVYINFLRNKLDKPFGKDSIKTKIGFGYYFED